MSTLRALFRFICRINRQALDFSRHFSLWLTQNQTNQFVKCQTLRAPMPRPHRSQTTLEQILRGGFLRRGNSALIKDSADTLKHRSLTPTKFSHSILQTKIPFLWVAKGQFGLATCGFAVNSYKACGIGPLLLFPSCKTPHSWNRRCGARGEERSLRLRAL